MRARVHAAAVDVLNPRRLSGLLVDRDQPVVERQPVLFPLLDRGRVETYPLYFAGGAWRDLGVGGNWAQGGTFTLTNGGGTSADLVDRFALHDKTGVETGAVPH